MNTMGEAWLDAVTRAVATGAANRSDPQAWNVSEVDGQPVTEGELHAALDRLTRWGCIKAIRAWGSDLPVRVLPLGRVHEVPAVDGSLAAYFDRLGPPPTSDKPSSPGGSSPTHYYDQRSYDLSGSTIANAQFGNSNSMNIESQTISSDNREQILTGVQQVRQVMPEDSPRDLAEAVDAIETEAKSPTTTKARLRDRIEAGLVAAGSSEAVRVALNHLQALLA